MFEEQILLYTCQDKQSWSLTYLCITIYHVNSENLGILVVGVLCQIIVHFYTILWGFYQWWLWPRPFGYQRLTSWNCPLAAILDTSRWPPHGYEMCHCFWSKHRTDMWYLFVSVWGHAEYIASIGTEIWNEYKGQTAIFRPHFAKKPWKMRVMLMFCYISHISLCLKL